jgi:Short C-terminal domain
MPGMLLRGVARTAVVAGTATAVSNRVSRRQAERWSSQGQGAPAYLAETPAAPAPPTESRGGDYTAELEKLAKLRDDGVISAEDFEAKKKQLLGIRGRSGRAERRSDGHPGDRDVLVRRRVETGA